MDLILPTGSTANCGLRNVPLNRTGRALEQQQHGGRRCEVAGDVCTAQESDLPFDLARYAGFKPWLVDANCRHQLADGDNLDFQSDGRAGTGVIDVDDVSKARLNDDKSFVLVEGIGIGGNLAVPPLPHHPAYGSVQGGSVGYAAVAGAMEARPMLARKAFGRAMASAGLLLMRQGPCALPAVRAASSCPMPRRRSSAKAGAPARPLFPCDGSEPSPDPLVEAAQYRRSFAEAEVAAPSFQIERQLLGYPHEARAPRPHRQRPHTLLEADHSLRAIRRLGAFSSVKLKPRNLRRCGGATALLCLLIFSFKRLTRKCSTLAITRSPARALRT